jgi:hypothetical protein
LLVYRLNCDRGIAEKQSRNQRKREAQDIVNVKTPDRQEFLIDVKLLAFSR